MDYTQKVCRISLQLFMKHETSNKPTDQLSHAQNNRWKSPVMLASIDSQTKSIHNIETLTEWPTVCTCWCNRKRDVAAKCLPLARITLIFVDPEIKVNKTWCASVAIFAVWPQCQVSVEFIVQQDSVRAHRSQQFSDINISQGSVKTHMKCDWVFHDCFTAKFTAASERINSDVWRI